MIIAIIPARSGSKGFKDKNVSKINNITLLEYAVNSAKQSGLVEEIFISTDSVLYEKIALDAGAKSLGLRPDHLSGDNAKTIDVLTSFLLDNNMSHVTHIVLLQPTSPVRSGELIDDCIGLSIKNSESVVTIHKIDDPHPCKMKIIEKGYLKSYLKETQSEVNRQDLDEVYCLTGAVYVSTARNILKNNSMFSKNTIPYISDTFVNIDSKDDFEYLEYLVHMDKVRLPL